ncbi:hypothetical protein COB57_02875 [Candidatus Peregrinibacteria bacterium]|nr:MAG: hypothetical protein COB57_02875 [Candidatus Peregrinibacteria bacterium]
MTYKNTIQKTLSDLPDQINILKESYLRTDDRNMYEGKMKDLYDYEKRMKEGLIFLQNIEDPDVVESIEKIRECSRELTNKNTQRYLDSLKKHRKQQGIVVSQQDIDALILEIQKVPLIHTTKNPEALQVSGIKPAAALWMTEHKSCANAMDIVLGLDKCVFLTHGFCLDVYSNDCVMIDNSLINKSTIVSSLDLFTFVLNKTQKNIPCAIETEEWIDSLSEYSKHLFRGDDFWKIKAEYVLTFFLSLDEYHSFAKTHFYTNVFTKCPEGEVPFFGEIKVFQEIQSDCIHKN